MEPAEASQYNFNQAAQRLQDMLLKDTRIYERQAALRGGMAPHLVPILQQQIKAHAANLRHNEKAALGSEPDVMTSMAPQAMHTLASMESSVLSDNISESLVAQGLQLVNEIAADSSS
jgi:hypothetical protein